MHNMGQAGEACPFEFNFDETTFKVGDLVSFRVTGTLSGRALRKSARSSASAGMNSASAAPPTRNQV